jgi:hypothetical protein
VVADYTGGFHQNLETTSTTTTYWRENEVTVVKDQEADGAITFVMPVAQIPDTMDKKAITEAVLAKGTIYLAH